MRKIDEIERQDSCWNKAGMETTVFVLLDHDVAAPDTIRFWCAERVRKGKNTWHDEQIKEALAIAARIDIELKLDAQEAVAVIVGNITLQDEDAIKNASDHFVHDEFAQKASEGEVKQFEPCSTVEEAIIGASEGKRTSFHIYGGGGGGPDYNPGVGAKGKGGMSADDFSNGAGGTAANDLCGDLDAGNKDPA